KVNGVDGGGLEEGNKPLGGGKPRPYDEAPNGMVPIILPPLPSGESALSVVRSSSRKAATNGEGGMEISSRVGASSASVVSDVVSDELLQQLSLFEVPPVHTELVQTLHLPSPGSPTNASLFLDDQSEQEVRVTNTQVIASEEGLHLLVKSLRAFGAFALDTETSSDEPRRAELVGISLAAVPGEAYYIPVGHTTSLEDQKQLPLTFVIEKLKPLLEDATVAKYMHNA